MALTAIGYSLEDPHATVRAYRNHFRGDDGEALDADDLRILYNLVGKIERGDSEK
jgi:N-acetylmuramoyl-L-alanine amidase